MAREVLNRLRRCSSRREMRAERKALALPPARLKKAGMPLERSPMSLWRTASQGVSQADGSIFEDLLSSQPLCFNLFGHLQKDLGLASRVIANLPLTLERILGAIEQAGGDDWAHEVRERYLGA
jgi:hypothetical protein